MVPVRLRRLTFGLRQVRKITRPPGWALWLIVFLADKAAKNFNMLVVTVYETSQKMFFFRWKQLFQRLSHVTYRIYPCISRSPIFDGKRQLLNPLTPKQAETGHAR